jgi:hypothetical protein
MRARQGGIPKPAAVLLVSALKGWGVEELLIRLHREVGVIGDVWVVSMPLQSCRGDNKSSMLCYCRNYSLQRFNLHAFRRG